MLNKLLDLPNNEWMIFTQCQKKSSRINFILNVLTCYQIGCILIKKKPVAIIYRAICDLCFHFTLIQSFSFICHSLSLSLQNLFASSAALFLQYFFVGIAYVRCNIWISLENLVIKSFVYQNVYINFSFCAIAGLVDKFLTKTKQFMIIQTISLLL